MYTSIIPMTFDHPIIIIASAAGLVVGLLVAEYFYIKSRNHASHVVPATIVNNSHRIVQQKLFYYAVLLTLFFVEFQFHIRVNEALWWLTGFAIVGGDVQKLANKFFRLK